MAKSIFKTIKALMTRPGRNLQVNEISVYVSGNRIVAQGVSTNEYGGRYSNEDTQTIYAKNLPNWLWNKLADMKGKYFAIDANDEMTIYGDAGVA